MPGCFDAWFLVSASRARMCDALAPLSNGVRRTQHWIISPIILIFPCRAGGVGAGRTTHTYLQLAPFGFESGAEQRPYTHLQPTYVLRNSSTSHTVFFCFCEQR